MFALGVEGLVTDQFGQVLLIQRSDSRTWALPGGGLEANELPSDGMVRELFEETGYKVFPVRLVQVSYIRGRNFDLLIFVLRGLLRGGSAQTSDETLAVQFHKPDRLPFMVRSHHERLFSTLYHPGGPPHLREQEKIPLVIHLLRKSVYRLLDLQRWWQGQPLYQSPRQWHLETALIVPDGQGQVLWHEQNGMWHLPGGPCPKGQSPWAAAAHLAQAQTGQPITITDLAGVYVTPENRMTLCFMGKIGVGTVAAACRWVTGEEIGNAAAPLHSTFIQNALTPRETTQFYYTNTPIHQ
ncbi:MAG: NUDIX domain-containing protein [Anaerolineae bacterium]|nr:NUDIX domain-containing protein [Anaerolineae bacterium]